MRASARPRITIVSGPPLSSDVLYDLSLLTGMKCVFDPKSRSDSGAEGADPAGVSAERFQAASWRSVCAEIVFNVLTNYFTYHIVVTIRMASRNALSGFRRSSQVAPLTACASAIRDKTMGSKAEEQRRTTVFAGRQTAGGERRLAWSCCRSGGHHRWRSAAG